MNAASAQHFYVIIICFLHCHLYGLDEKLLATKFHSYSRDICSSYLSLVDFEIYNSKAACPVTGGEIYF